MFCEAYRINGGYSQRRPKRCEEDRRLTTGTQRGGTRLDPAVWCPTPTAILTPAPAQDRIGWSDRDQRGVVNGREVRAEPVPIAWTFMTLPGSDCTHGSGGGSWEFVLPLTDGASLAVSGPSRAGGRRRVSGSPAGSTASPSGAVLWSGQTPTIPTRTVSRSRSATGSTSASWSSVRSPKRPRPPGAHEHARPGRDHYRRGQTSGRPDRMPTSAA